MSDSPKPLHVRVDMSSLLAALDLLLSDGDGVPSDLAARMQPEIEAVVRAAQIDPLAPKDFYTQLGVNAFVLLARRAFSDQIAADLLKRLQSD